MFFELDNQVQSIQMIDPDLKCNANLKVHGKNWAEVIIGDPIVAKRIKCTMKQSRSRSRVN